MTTQAIEYLENEEIVVEIAPHWVIFVKPFVWLLITMSILLVGPFFAFTRFQLIANTPALYQFLAFIAFTIAFIQVIKSYLHFSSAKLILTSKRMMIQNGFFKQSSVEILLINIERLEVVQNFIERLFNYGKLLVGSHHSHTMQFSKIAYPKWFRNIVQNEILKNHV